MFSWHLIKSEYRVQNGTDTGKVNFFCIDLCSILLGYFLIQSHSAHSTNSNWFLFDPSILSQNSTSGFLPPKNLTSSKTLDHQLYTHATIYANIKVILLDLLYGISFYGFTAGQAGKPLPKTSHSVESRNLCQNIWLTNHFSYPMNLLWQHSLRRQPGYFNVFLSP